MGIYDPALSTYRSTTPSLILAMENLENTGFCVTRRLDWETRDIGVHRREGLYCVYPGLGKYRAGAYCTLRIPLFAHTVSNELLRRFRLLSLLSEMLIEK